VNETPSDAALFRFAAFQVDWIEPLQSWLTRHHDLPLERLSERLIRLVLLQEAVAWIDIGQAVDYFASPSVAPPVERWRAIDDHAFELDWFKEDFEVVTNQVVTAIEAGFEADLGEFDAALAEALDDLTSSRWTFLRLVCFADSDEWSSRLSQLRLLADRLYRRPGAALPGGFIDDVAWGLEGATSQIRRLRGVRLPAEWRAQNLIFLGADRGQRLKELQSVRREVAGAAEWIAEDERTSAELRIATAFRFRYDSDEDESPPPFLGEEVP
jgi:hypothetical protein